ncbi:hypothetical protein CDEST_12458 [Colletotrichum destructivum]|uniref:Uncharacterized protein n=1 Tax=Colletotrichum destructivum TaxID=34406 RepID=A0AAX4IVZ0_9PEZI|nr:hypothetical protein CDEST_12458 [Colletotrichum destructivum]
MKRTGRISRFQTSVITTRDLSESTTDDESPRPSFSQPKLMTQCISGTWGTTYLTEQISNLTQCFYHREAQEMS